MLRPAEHGKRFVEWWLLPVPCFRATLPLSLKKTKSLDFGISCQLCDRNTPSQRVSTSAHPRSLHPLVSILFSLFSSDSDKKLFSYLLSYFNNPQHRVVCSFFFFFGQQTVSPMANGQCQQPSFPIPCPLIFYEVELCSAPAVRLQIEKRDLTRQELF